MVPRAWESGRQLIMESVYFGGLSRNALSSASGTCRDERNNVQHGGGEAVTRPQGRYQRWELLAAVRGFLT